MTARSFGLLSAIIAAALLGALPAKAAVTISSAATQNMSCNAGVCTPTAANANLNVADLENYLSSGNLTVTTTGSAEATDIDVSAGISWVSAGVLSLVAYRSVVVTQPIAVNGTSGLSIQTNNGGSGGVFAFRSGANVSFLDLASSLTINGAAYTLENSVPTLANAIAANAAGNFALASNYDASVDGTYTNSPINTEFGGNFEGLGNTVSNLSVSTNSYYVGLFARTGSGDQAGGSIENIVLENASISGKGREVGALIGLNTGVVSGSYVTGAVRSDYYHNIGSGVGLLAGGNSGTISLSGAVGTVTAKNVSAVGGLVGGNEGTISESYANCVVADGDNSYAGGLAGGNLGPITRSYASGAARSGATSDVGGLVGNNSEESTVVQSYSTAAVTLSKEYPRGYRGGLIGIDYSPGGSNSSDYWDTSTSKVTNLHRGAGNVKDDPGITGETTLQLQAELPAGFDPTVWAENPNINGGLPYLINNPPR